MISYGWIVYIYLLMRYNSRGGIYVSTLFCFLSPEYFSLYIISPFSIPFPYNYLLEDFYVFCRDGNDIYIY